MSSGSIGLDAYTRARSAINSLTVVQLKTVLRTEGLTVGGTKSVLQNRLETHLQQIYSKNDVAGFQLLDQLIRQPNGTPLSSSSYSSPAPSVNLTNRPQPNSTYGLPTSWANHSNGHGSIHLNFRESPFYEHVAKLSQVQTLKAVDASRATHEFTVRVPAEWSAKLDRHSPERHEYKILLFGACDPVSAFTKLDVAFPHQFEVRINGMEVRSNWKGLKNKPGSTRPADVTEVVRASTTFENSIAVIYALTAKKFYLRLDLVKVKTLESLVQKLQDGKSISKEQVLRDMRAKANDADIVATSTVMSLKCPLSYTRLKNPCRGSQCSHNQCFDATSYLQLQQQAPTWICPICNRSATFDNLQIDQYVADIVQSVSEDVEKVTITPEGKWSPAKDSDNGNQGRIGVKSEDWSSDDEAVQILDSPKPQTSFPRPLQSSQPSMTPSRTSSLAAPSSSSNSARNSNNKRPYDVVDLTLESDEDEVHVPKRPASSVSITSMHGFSPAPNLTFSNGHRPSLPSMSFPIGSRPPPTPTSARPYGSSSMEGYR